MVIRLKSVLTVLLAVLLIAPADLAADEVLTTGCGPSDTARHSDLVTGRAVALTAINAPVDSARRADFRLLINDAILREPEHGSGIRGRATGLGQPIPIGIPAYLNGHLAKPVNQALGLQDRALFQHVARSRMAWQEPPNPPSNRQQAAPRGKKKVLGALLMVGGVALGVGGWYAADNMRNNRLAAIDRSIAECPPPPNFRGCYPDISPVFKDDPKEMAVMYGSIVGGATLFGFGLMMVLK